MRFEALANAAGLVKRMVPKESLDPLYQADDIEIWELHPRSSGGGGGGGESGLGPGDVRFIAPGEMASAGDGAGASTTALGKETVVWRIEVGGIPGPALALALGGGGGLEGGSAISSDLWASAICLTSHLALRFADSKCEETFLPGAEAGSAAPTLGRKGLEGMRVLELGSGVGLLALAAHRLGAATVLATDRAPALGLLKHNIVANGIPGKVVEVLAYDWADPPPPQALGDAGEPWDIVLCADCCYSMPSVEPLLGALALVATPGHTQILIANEQRTALDTFLSASSARFTVQSHGIREVEGPNGRRPVGLYTAILRS